MAILKPERENSFCSFPWNGLQIHVSGEVRPCCMIDDLGVRYQPGLELRQSLANSSLKGIREQMLAGEAPRACRACYEEDRMGIQSVRLFSPALDSSSDLNRQAIARAEISLTNTCNLDCVMCRPEFSSKVQRLYKEFSTQHPIEERVNYPSFSIPLADVPALVEQVAQAKEVRLIGGEPLLTEAGRLFIQLWAKGNYPGRLEVVTNGTFLDEEILADLSACRNAQVNMSVDGFGEVYTWIRGHEWEDIETRILQAHKKVRLKLIPTINVYNLLNLPELARFCEGHQIRLRLGHVLRHPHHLSAWAWPAELRQKLTVEYRNLWGNDRDDLLQFLKKPGDFSPQRREQFLNWTHFMNQKRGRNWFDVQPESRAYFL